MIAVMEEAMPTIPQKCPSCSAPMVVTQLTCSICGTGVVGHFELSPFFRLPEPDLQFLEIFVRNRGNIKEMERETGVIERMGFPASVEDTVSGARQEILERLGRSEIDVEEATRLLNQLKKRNQY